MVQIKPMMCDLCSGSGEWWSLVVRAAEDWYTCWQTATALQRGALVPSLPENLADARFIRLEARAFGMLRDAVTDRVREELISKRTLTCYALLCTILKTYQPGGAQERARLLDALQYPGKASSPQDAVSKLQLWHRWLGRAGSLGVQRPDASLLLKGLDALSAPLLGQHYELRFRVSSARQQLQLDHIPSEAGVLEFARVLQSEFEVLSLAIPEKASRVARLGEGDGKEKGKGAGKGKDEVKGDGKKKGKPCKNWMTAGGCRFAAKCTFAHEPAVTIQSGRCFRCSAEGHRKDACPYGDTGAESSNKQGTGAEAKAKAKAAPGVRKAGVGQGSGDPSGAADQGESGNLSGGQAQAELLREATEALKALALKAMRDVAPAPSSPVDGMPRCTGRWLGGGSLELLEGGGEPKVCTVVRSTSPVGLLDSGATCCMRQALPGELEGCTKRTVALAVGSTDLHVNSCGTILTREEVMPIVSLSLLVRIGYKIRWKSEGNLELRSKKGLRVPVSTQSGCPEVGKSCALRMIGEIEGYLRRVEGVRRVAPVVQGDLTTDPLVVLDQIRCQRDAGEDTLGLVRCWLALAFPEAPADLLDRAAVSATVVGIDSPWNRRRRRQLSLAKGGILLNLFGSVASGELRQVAQAQNLELLDVDVDEDPSLESTFAGILGLALEGRIRIVLGEPPCRTFGALRTQPGGPPVARDRSGPGRWGKVYLSEAESAKVQHDNIMVIRLMSILRVAHAANQALGRGPVGVMIAQPRDPMTYVACDAPDLYPCLFATLEWHELQKELGLSLIACDQGVLGCGGVKLTHLATNLNLSWLTPVTAGVSQPLGDEAGSCVSVAWSPWPPGLVYAVQVAVRDFFAETAVRAMSETDRAAMKRHVERGHLPYWKRCRSCVEGRSKDRRHVRAAVPEANVLCADLVGPYAAGEDEKIARVRYALVCVLVLPDLERLQKQEHQKQDSLVGEGEGCLEAAGAGLSDLDDGDSTEPGPIEPADPLLSPESEEPGPDGWESPGVGFREVVEDSCAGELEALEAVGRNLLERLPTVELTFTEVLGSKRGREVLTALRRVVARISALGYPIVRLMTDSGAEFVNRDLLAWAASREIQVSNTGADDFRRNGRAERCVGILKGIARTLLRSIELPDKAWPFAFRYAAELRLRSALQYLGHPGTLPLVPFGTSVFARQRSWKVSLWEAKVVQAMVLAPARDVANAFLVQTVNGEYFVTSVLFRDVLTCPNPPAVVNEDTLHDLEPPLRAPQRRVRRKVPEAAPIPQPAPIIPRKRFREKTTLAALRKHFFTEDEHAAMLADTVPFQLHRAIEFLLTSSWVQSALMRDERKLLRHETEDDAGMRAAPATAALLTDIASEVHCLERELVSLRAGWSEPECDALRACHVGGELESLSARGVERELESLSARGVERELVALRACLAEHELVGWRACPAEHEHAVLKACRVAAVAEASDHHRVSDEVPAPLQTRTYSNEEVFAEWSEPWIECTRKELSSLLDVKGALARTTEEEIQRWVEEGAEVTRIPSKTVYTRKAVSGRRKCRIVLCGNALPANLDESSLDRRLATYAGGVDISLLRVLLAEAVEHRYHLAVWDISTAFLNAPSRPRDLKAAHRGKTQIVIAAPPRQLVRRKLIPSHELWRVVLAVYGLDTSPRDWTLFRNETLRDLTVLVEGEVLRLKVCAADSNIWFVVRLESVDAPLNVGVVCGWLAIYVDDFLGAARRVYVEAIYHKIKGIWDSGELEHVVCRGQGDSVRFNGLELQWDSDGSGLYVHQSSYIKDLVGRYPEVKCQAVPLLRPLLSETAEDDIEGHLKACQKVCGELLWLAVRTRPDLVFACSRIASAMCKRPQEAYGAALGVVGYLKTTPVLGLFFTTKPSAHWGEARRAVQASGLLEVHTDAGFAELVSTISGCNLGDSLAVLLNELYSSQGFRKILLNDNAAAIGILAADTNSWRTRHLKIRAGALREKVALFEWEVLHLDGQHNTADIGTKILQQPRVERLRDLIGMSAVEPAVSTPASAGVARVAKVLGALVFSLCVEPSAGVRDQAEFSEGPSSWIDWILFALLVVWTIAVIAVWEVLKGLFGQATRRPFEPEPHEEPEGPEEADPEDVAQEIVHELHYIDDTAQFRVSLDPQPASWLYPAPPLRLRAGWPDPVQLTFEDLARSSSVWGGDESALFLLPPADQADFFESPSAGRAVVVTRWHSTPRVRMFTPVHTTTPFRLEVFTGLRRTLVQYLDGRRSVIDDDWRVRGAGQAYLQSRWRGRTELQIDVDLLSPREAAQIRRLAIDQSAPLRRRYRRHWE
ncbi:GIP [Symbiodinium sp. CCMP2592]|nr:GIP [Symbiodinium sp. CCMP2592]